MGLREAEGEECRTGSKGVGKPFGCIFLKTGANPVQEAYLFPGTSYPMSSNLFRNCCSTFCSTVHIESSQNQKCPVVTVLDLLFGLVFVAAFYALCY